MALDNLEITQLLEEVKKRLSTVEKNQGVIIGHLEALVADEGEDDAAKGEEVQWPASK